MRPSLRMAPDWWNIKEHEVTAFVLILSFFHTTFFLKKLNVDYTVFEK
jgi:hypothetical protein